MNFDFQTRPIDQWPGTLKRHADRKRSPFSVGYGKLIKDLNRELAHLGAKTSVVLMALRDDEIRNDGRPRANAAPAHPGVILVVETRRGTMRFPCDTYTDWADNLRAISLALAALRAVDRYGVTQNAEQYTGWKSLPPPNGDDWTRAEASQFLRTLLGEDFDTMQLADAIRAAEFATHPDRGGRAEDFKKVQQARKLLLS